MNHVDSREGEHTDSKQMAGSCNSRSMGSPNWKWKLSLGEQAGTCLDKIVLHSFAGPIVLFLHSMRADHSLNLNRVM